MAKSRGARLMREIFRKVPVSEKKAIFKEGSVNKMAFYGKGESDDLIKLVLDQYVDSKILTFNYALNSPRILSNQNIVLNFSYGEDRYFLHAMAEVYDDRIHVSANADVYILQRRKTPRLEFPDAYPRGVNIISYNGKVSMYECKFLDFSSGGCRVEYTGHLPLFKLGDVIKCVLHMNHRKPLELDGEIKHHVFDKAKGQQTFGVQFVIKNTMLENKMLVVFMDVQRELFLKWDSGDHI